jgi:hypothetical protein
MSEVFCIIKIQFLDHFSLSAIIY